MVLILVSRPKIFPGGQIPGSETNVKLFSLVQNFVSLGNLVLKKLDLVPKLVPELFNWQKVLIVLFVLEYLSSFLL